MTCGFRSLSGATFERVQLIPCPALVALVNAMVASLEVRLWYSPNIDIRFWPELACGWVPNEHDPRRLDLEGWHQDGYFDTDEHRMYCIGCGAQTEFWGGWTAPPGVVVGFKGDSVHRCMPAQTTGPRLFIRTSMIDINFDRPNLEYEPKAHLRTWLTESQP